MIEHDQGDGDGPQTFHVGAEPTITGRGPRFVGQTGGDLRLGRHGYGVHRPPGPVRV